MFAVYSYITPILTDRAGLALAARARSRSRVWGLGMVAGSLLGGRLMDWRPVRDDARRVRGHGRRCSRCSRSPRCTRSPRSSTRVPARHALVLPTGLQMRLMDVSGDAQTLGAALNHSAFNVANALGAWLGGAVLAAGLGLTAPMLVAVGLTLAGMAIFLMALALERRGYTAPAARSPHGDAPQDVAGDVLQLGHVAALIQRGDDQVAEAAGDDRGDLQRQRAQRRVVLAGLLDQQHDLARPALVHRAARAPSPPGRSPRRLLDASAASRRARRRSLPR